MPLTLVDHPLVQHLLTGLRDARTPHPEFRALARRLTTALVLEATRDLSVEAADVETPLERAAGVRLGAELVTVPVLRAGLGMLEAVTELYPGTSVGYVGLERDDATLEPATYYEKLPDVDGRYVMVLDPMLATGGTASAACSLVASRGSAGIRLVCIVAAPEGVKRMAVDHPDVPIFAAALDRELNDRGYILPGLGDFGDRLFGTGADSGLPPAIRPSDLPPG
jgi:uracil phosphoribosyltransferase